MHTCVAVLHVRKPTVATCWTPHISLSFFIEPMSVMARANRILAIQAPLLAMQVQLSYLVARGYEPYSASTHIGIILNSPDPTVQAFGRLQQESLTVPSSRSITTKSYDRATGFSWLRHTGISHSPVKLNLRLIPGESEDAHSAYAHLGSLGRCECGTAHWAWAPSAKDVNPGNESFGVPSSLTPLATWIGVRGLPFRERPQMRPTAEC